MRTSDPAHDPLPRVLPAVDGDPVLVAGAGPVGQTTALLLHRWGLPVVVVDRREERDQIGSKAICQARDVLDVWETVGAGAVLADEGVTWNTARTFYRDSEIACWSFVDRGRSPFPPFVNIAQHRTETVLDQRLTVAGVPIEWGRSVTRLDQDADGVTVSLDGPHGPETRRASHVIVATGAQSGDLRRCLGVHFEGESFDDRFLICDIRAELPGWEAERRFYFDPEWNPGRQVLVHACPESVYRIDWQVPPEYDLEADAASGGLDARIRQIVGDRPYEVVWKSVYRFHTRHADRMRVGRVLLAGDAAHLVAPFGARGLNTGVWDAENAAWKVAFVAHGWAGDALLESYHDERLAATLDNVEITSATMRFLVPGNAQQAQARRELLDAAAADPQAGRSVDSGRFAEPFWYVDSPLTTPDPTRPFAGRPAKGAMPDPAPGVLVPDAPIVPTAVAGGVAERLRTLARDGFLVLGAAAGGASGGPPVRALAWEDIDPSGECRAALTARDGELWVLRPDAYVAAVVDRRHPDAITAAVRRALGG